MHTYECMNLLHNLPIHVEFTFAIQTFDPYFYHGLYKGISYLQVKMDITYN